MSRSLLEAAATAAIAFLAIPLWSAEAESPEAPDLRGVTAICQEWHNWFYAASGAKGQDVEWWGDNCWIDDKVSEVASADPYRTNGPLWWRFLGASRVYPMIGPYSSENPEVIRWQLRVMKAAGFDGTIFHLYPEPKKGEVFCNLEAYEHALALAEEEGYKLGVQDEIQFMPVSAKGVDAFIARASSAMEVALKHPKALLTVKGMPVYQYESYMMQGWTSEDFERMMQGVEAKAGRKIYWMSCGPEKLLMSIPSLKCCKWPSSIVMKAENLDKANLFGYGGSAWTFNGEPKALKEALDGKWASALESVAASSAAAGKDFSPWIYPGFMSHPHYLPRDGGRQLLESVAAALRQKPETINFAAWNERIEKSYFEPSWSVDDPDPYHWVKLIAKMKRIEFKAPPLPPKECVDPLMWSVLYGIDRTPPRIVDARIHPAESCISADCVDDMSGLAELRVSGSPIADVSFSDGKLAANGCKAEIVKLKDSIAGECLQLNSEDKGSISLSIPTGDGSLLAKACLGVLLKVEEGAALAIRPNYPCGPEPAAKYRLDGNPRSRIPKAPTIHATDGFIWQPISLGMLTPDTGKPTTSISLAFECKSEAGGKPMSPAVKIKGIAIFPAELQKTEGSFSFKAPNDCVKTFVAPLPPELPFHQFFKKPIALQCVDKEGNVSPLQIVSVEPMKKWLTHNLKLYKPPLSFSE